MRCFSVHVARCMLAFGGLVGITAGLWAKDSCHGTSINFEDSPADAAKKAIKEKKLVFVLHVSGNFEDPRFT